jgi:hypothetical protein
MSEVPLQHPCRPAWPEQWRGIPWGGSDDGGPTPTGEPHLFENAPPLKDRHRPLGIGQLKGSRGRYFLGSEVALYDGLLHSGANPLVRALLCPGEGHRGWLCGCEREGGAECVREREGGTVCARETEREGLCVRYRKREGDSVCVRATD